MADKRMFSKKITNCDEFISMSASAQALYFHLNQEADDDGFNNQVSIAMFRAHASADDLKCLIEKKYVISFESGVVVIKHWRMHNILRKDRYTPTSYQEEFKALTIKENGSYSVDGMNVIEDKSSSGGVWLPNGCQVVATDKVSIDKDRIDKDNKESIPTPRKEKHKFGTYKNVLLTYEEQQKLIEDYGMNEAFEAVNYLSEYIEMKGSKYKSHYLALRKWVFDALKEKRGRKTYQKPSQLDELARACEELEALHGHTTDK